MRLIYIALFITMLASCGKDASNDSTDGSDDLDFTQITPTDEQGAALGDADTTDWTLQDAWSPEIQSLFGSEVLDQACGGNSVTIYPAFPNPSTGIFAFNVDRPVDTSMDIIFINADKQVLSEIRDAPNSIAQYNANSFASTQDSFIRMYYVIKGDNCYWKGHGDLKIK